MAFSADAACSQTSLDACVCSFAELTENNSALWLSCFSDWVCPYDEETGEFCSGHGECDYENFKCECDSKYGLDDCSEKYIQYEVNPGMLGTMMGFGALEACVILGLFYWLQKYAAVPEVKAMSVTFTNLTLVGLLFLSASGIVIGIGYNGATCVIVEWFTFAGGTLILVCAAVKAYRISLIFARRDFKAAQLGDRELFKFLGGAMSMTFLLLILFTIVNFVTGGAYRRKVDETFNGKPQFEFRCNSETPTQVIYYIMCAYATCLLIFTLKYGNESQAAGELYKETDCIYIGSNIGTVAFIIFGVIITFTSDYTLQIAVRGFGTLLTTGLLLYLLFAPKVRAVYFAATLGDDGLTDDERKISKQYRLAMAERSGKELLLVLNTIIQELQQRMEHNLIKIELSDVLLDEAKDLIADMTDLLERPDENKRKKIKNLSSGALAIAVTPKGAVQSKHGTLVAAKSPDDGESP